MRSRWSESEAAQLGGADHCETQLRLLAYATWLVGAEPDLAMHGGGNSSCKCSLGNVFGETRLALFVKASGMELGEVEPQDFVGLDLDYLVRLLDLPELSDEAMAAEFACHCLRPARTRPALVRPRRPPHRSVRQGRSSGER